MTAGEIRISQAIEADATIVWQQLADIAGHVTWMADADSIQFVGDQRSGVGTRFECVTRLGPLRTTDRMEVTSWDEGREIGVRHKGLVTGEGRFTLAATAPGRSTVTWSERLQFPWTVGGPITGFLARPVLRWVWRSNLRRLASLAAAAAD